MKRKKSIQYDVEYITLDDGRVLVWNKFILSKEGHVVGKTVLRNKDTDQLYVSVRLEGKKYSKAYLISKLVLIIFGKGDEQHKLVRHKDRNKKNNHIDNLCWQVNSRFEIDFADSITYRNKVYKHCDACKGFFISIDGKIVSQIHIDKAVFPIKQRKLDGIACISYKYGETGETFYTHKLVYAAWGGVPYNEQDKFIWKDGNRKNNSVDNLKEVQYGDMIVNQIHEGKRDPMRFQKSMNKKYGKNKRPWLTDPRFPLKRTDIQVIRKLKKNSIDQLSKQFGVSWHRIYNIREGRTYKNI